MAAIQVVHPTTLCCGQALDGVDVLMQSCTGDGITVRLFLPNLHIHHHQPIIPPSLVTLCSLSDTSWTSLRSVSLFCEYPSTPLRQP
jgi:hypothetical protein